jgi:hypothetical protein
MYKGDMRSFFSTHRFRYWVRLVEWCELVLKEILGKFLGITKKGMIF